MQLADDLRRRISSGEFPPRTRIPSLRQLEAEYDVAQMTVRRAIAVLVQEKLLISMPGRGTFVA